MLASYTPLISAYASIFELSVALNFSYAASSQFREVMKSGFLQNIKKIDQSYAESIADVSSRLSVMSDEALLDEDKVKELKEKLESTLSELKSHSTAVSSELKVAQDAIADRIKPMYIYSAIFSLYFLFLGGQESINSIFPTDGVNALIIISCIAFIGLVGLSFTRYCATSMMAILIITFAVFVGMFTPYIIDLGVNNKHLVDVAIVIAFLPFIISMARLFLLTSKLEVKHRWAFWKMRWNAKKLDKHCKELRKSSDYFKDL